MKEKRKKIMLLLIGIVLLLGVLIGVSYAWWTFRATQESVNTIKSDCLKVEFIDDTEAIHLEKAYPITDYEAEKLKAYRFTIKNTCNTSIVYDVSMEMLEEENRLLSEYIAVEFDGEEKKLLNTFTETTPTLSSAVEGRYLTHGELRGLESQSYSIKLWIDESVTIEDDAMDKNFTSKIVVEAILNQIVQYKEDILNGADPVLADGLIPVEINNTGKVTKANVDQPWYSYENKEWANAVILEDESVTYQDGEEIPESNIESYFVWIPKYSYQIWDLGEYESLTSIDESKVHEIPIKFGLKNTSDENAGECTTPMTSGATGNCKIGDYMTPPAFITMGTNGLWVGKFETGYKGATSTTAAQVNASDSTKIQIKPNVYSWRSIQPANAHLASYNYKRELDSHMMKNTEWGAVAYLQHSKYGSSTSVRINNNSAYITGYAAKNEPTCGFTGKNELCNINESTNLGIDGTNTYNYKNALSQIASTTGNYTGIYDMSGGVAEYTMGARGSITAGITGFSSPNVPDAKYYDIYNANSTQTTYQYRILGDGTSEFGPFASVTYGNRTRRIGSWYGNSTHFVSSTMPTFVRSLIMDHGSEAGIAGFGVYSNDVVPSIGFRIVLAI